MNGTSIWQVIARHTARTNAIVALGFVILAGCVEHVPGLVLMGIYPFVYYLKELITEAMKSIE